MKKVTDGKVVVIRGGEMTIKALEKAVENKTCKIDSQGKLYDVSVQVSPKAGSIIDKKLMAKLCEAIPNEDISFVYAKHILDAKGVIQYDPLPTNAYHGLLSGLTIEEMVRIFKAN